jgi:hypothetical protein
VRDGDLHTNLDKNRRNCDDRGYIDQRHREREERELRRAESMLASMDLPLLSTVSWSARNATAMTSRIGDVPNTTQTMFTQRALSRIQIISPDPKSLTQR